jgi:DNA polymerase-3 subunit chi
MACEKMIPNICFYIEPYNTYLNSLKLCCKLAEKAYQKKLQTFIYTPTPDITNTLNDLLWTFSDISFIPHIDPQKQNYYSPIVISHNSYPANFDDILINLTNIIPPCYKFFKKIIEIVCQNDEIKKAGRQKYQYYHKNNYNIEIHNL